MLIWKTNSFDIKIASVRYRCLLPSRYLELHGYKCCFYAGNNPINFKNRSDSDVLIFVKSFTPYDLSLAKKAKQAGVPVILDICDNIFIDEYVSKSQFKPSEVFKEMSEVASAIVTTGVALKNTIQTQINPSVPIFVVPDANETVEDINYALSIGKWGRWLRLFLYSPISSISIIKNSLPGKIKTVKTSYSKYRQKIKSKFKDKYYNKLLNILSKYKKQTKTFLKKLIKLAYFHKYLHYINKIKNMLVNYANKKHFTSELAINTVVLQKPIINSVNLKENFNDSSVTVNKKIANSCKTVLWFGNHGAAYGNFGMLNLLDIAEPLIKVSQEINFRLLVVSNNYKKYCKYIQPLPFSTDYMEWDLFSIYNNISQSDVVIIPNSQCAFSICKSANRAILSLSLGVPVVATRTPALEDLNECIIIDDWEGG
ncbi:MAG: hypothetical protein HC836_25140 [Richelia sp. RM2_1_2]|nr:hypothetical protein [Richelia sp. SM1_7_0]NJO61417.1 hypothetical protein [Richelia sp. RM2_1_2]